MDARHSDKAYLWLVTFTHPDAGAPIRVARHPADVISQGFTFGKGWFEFALPDDTNSPPRGSITVPDLYKSFSTLLINVRKPARVRLQSVLSSDTNTVIEDYNFLYLRAIDSDEEQGLITGTLDTWNYLNDLYPAQLGSKARFPGLWI